MCDLCDKLFDCKKEMKKHRKTHSYKQIEECDFIGATPFTMEEHLGKSHSDQFECGLYEYVAKDLDSLEIRQHPIVYLV